MLTQRFGSSLQLSDEFVTDFLRLVKEHPGSCDEVWLATSYGFPKPEDHEDTARRLGAVAARLRGAGLRVSLQISNTIGHGQYMSACDCSGLVYDGSPVRNIVGPDGTVARYCFCWNDPVMRSYVRREVMAYAAAIRPYTVWIDDDLRANNHRPVRLGCFCPECIAAFNRRCGTAFTREALVHEINRGDGTVRADWIAFVRDGLGSFTYDVYSAIHEVSPETFAGLQNGANGGCTGTGLGHIFEAMERATGKKPKYRPGGGAYRDHNPGDMLAKMDEVSWQQHLSSGYVDEIRPEIENLPDVRYGKTIAGTCMETSLYLAAGANAMSYAMMMNDNEPMDWHGEMLAAFAAHREYWLRLCRASEGSVRAGLTVALGKEMWRARTKDDWDWCAEPFRQVPSVFRGTAIPTTFDTPNAPVYVLHPSALAGLTDEELRVLLGRPVLTDGECAARVNERIPGALNVDSVPTETEQFFEVFTDHPVNGAAAGRKWSQSFYIKSGHALFGKVIEPLGWFDTNSLNAVPVRPTDPHPYGCASALVKTSAGVKWAVFGHSPWNSVISGDRRDQLLRAVDAISGDRLTAVLETRAQAELLPRENMEGCLTSVSVLNRTIGQSGPLTLRLRRVKQTTALFMAQYRTPQTLTLTPDGVDRIAVLPSLDPWTVGTLFLEP